MRYVLAVACLALAGCTYGSGVALNGEHYRPVPEEHVAVLLEAPKMPYKVIGIVKAKGAHLASDASVYRKLQAAAAELGADAVIVESAAEKPRWLLPGQSYTNGTSNLNSTLIGDTAYGTGTYNETTTYMPSQMIAGLTVEAQAIRYQ